MPIISSTAPAAANPSPQKSELKPIGICLPQNSSIEIPNVSTSAAAAAAAAVNLTNRNTVNVSNASNFYPTTTVSAGQFQMGPLSVMVAKFTSNPSISTNRQQTVILQPRINQTSRSTSLQMNPIRGSAVIASQTISSTLTSTTPSISVRTRVLGGPTQSMPVLNLSAAVTSTNSATTNTVKQVFKGQKFISTSGNVETVNLVMASPNDVRNIRTNSANNEIKANMLTVHNINKVNGPKAIIPTSVVQQKLISINNAGQSTATVCPRFTNIIGPNVTGNKSGIINLTAGIPKSFILTSPANATISGPGAANMVANMVSISSTNFVPTTKISMTTNHIITGTTRHSVVTTNSIANPITQNNLLSPKATIYTVATTSVLNSVSTLPTTTISTVQQAVSYNNQIISTTSGISSSSTAPTQTLVSMKPTILATNLSPLKPTITTPNSPRPRILSRKRVQADSPVTMKNSSPVSISATAINGQQIITNSTLNVIDQRPISQMTEIVLTNNSDVSPSSRQLVNKNSDNVHVITFTSDGNLTPRKKPRKQLLEPTSPNKEIESDHGIINSNNLNKHNNNNIGAQTPVINETVPKEQVIFLKKPRFNLRPPPREDKLLKKDNNNLHPQYFMKYSDVRYKERKTPPTELFSQTQRPNYTWKTVHIAEQLREGNEHEKLMVHSTLNNFLKSLESEISPFSAIASKATLFGDSSVDTDKIDIVDKTCVKLNDVVRGNIQRTKIMLDLQQDAKQLLFKLSNDHKEKVVNFAKRLGSKRHLK